MIIMINTINKHINNNNIESMNINKHNHNNVNNNNDNNHHSNVRHIESRMLHRPYQTVMRHTMTRRAFPNPSLA